MNYYPHHIGDFNNATRHLTRTERSIYRDMLDLYYDTEKPLSLDMTALCRKLLARSDEESTAVEQVLNEFFTKTEHGWHHSRCEEVIQECIKNKVSHWGNSLTKEQRCSIQAARNAAKINATPNWLTDEQRSEIDAIYTKSSIMSLSTGVKHEVDHIVPLRGKKVCGLHVPWNLRVITAEENRRKSNLEVTA